MQQPASPVGAKMEEKKMDEKVAEPKKLGEEMKKIEEIKPEEPKKDPVQTLAELGYKLMQIPDDDEKEPVHPVHNLFFHGTVSVIQSMAAKMAVPKEPISAVIPLENKEPKLENVEDKSDVLNPIPAPGAIPMELSAVPAATEIVGEASRRVEPIQLSVDSNVVDAITGVKTDVAKTNN